MVVPLGVVTLPLWMSEPLLPGRYAGLAMVPLPHAPGRWAALGVPGRAKEFE
jgi:hypothetical protein